MAATTLHDLQKLLATPESAELGPGPRPGVLEESVLEGRLDELFDQGEVASANQPLIRALVLLWHDHLEAAHVIAQSIDDADGAIIHGIVHRREPDYPNAKYWCARAGRHPAFDEIGARAAKLVTDKLAGKGPMNPSAFVDLCAKAMLEGPGSFMTELRALQRIEFEVLLERWAGG